MERRVDMRRRQKEKWKKALVLFCGTALLVFGLRAVAGLVQSISRKLLPQEAEWPARIGEGLLLKDRSLFSYLQFKEEERGPFRWISEWVLDHSRYMLAAAPEADETLALLWEKKEGEDGGESIEKDSDGKNGAGTEKDKNTGGVEDAGNTAIGKNETDAGNTVGGKNETDAEGELQTSEEMNVQITEGLLESVMSENAAHGNYLPVSYAKGEVEAVVQIPVADEPISAGKETLRSRLLLENNYSIPDLANPDYLLSTYYIVDSITSTLPELFNGEELILRDLSIAPAKEDGYQILIYHTHASEAFADSRQGEVMDTVRGPGEKLAEYLRGYGYTVYHDMTAYDRKDGKDNRNAAYSTARPEIEAFLEKHPEVEVIIDLHRDSGAKRVATVNGKPTAQVMLFNGLCRNASGPIDYLDNPNLSGNLAFSLQTNLIGRVLFPNLMFRIYLKNYRYNQHFRERCMLIELGTDQNTVEEAYNAMEPLAQILDMVLRGS